MVTTYVTGSTGTWDSPKLTVENIRRAMEVARLFVDADVYPAQRPHYGVGHSRAAQCILEEAGGSVTDLEETRSGTTNTSC
jgi:hypothetical protein